ncbi:MAG: hypothetical protein IJT77_09075 [Clostridia bacterium]|nr:hypothetical protein [Clostridia bacterium]
MLKVNETHESYRDVLREEGASAPTLALTLSMSRDDYTIQVELLDRAYHETHPEAFREAMSDFLKKAEERLHAVGLPGLTA